MTLTLSYGSNPRVELKLMATCEHVLLSVVRNPHGRDASVDSYLAVQMWLWVGWFFSFICLFSNNKLFARQQPKTQSSPVSSQ